MNTNTLSSLTIIDDMSFTYIGNMFNFKLFFLHSQHYKHCVENHWNNFNTYSIKIYNKDKIVTNEGRVDDYMDYSTQTLGSITYYQKTVDTDH